MDAVSTRFPQWLRDAIDRQTPGQRRSDALRQVVIEGVTTRDFPMVVWRDGPSGRRPGLRGGPDIEEIVAVANLYNKDVSLADVAAEVGVSEQDVADALRFRVAYGEIMDDRLAIRHRALALAVRQD